MQMKTHRLQRDDGIPNSHLPVVVYKGALTGAELEGKAACALLERNGWGSNWISGIYPFWHFHTRGHETLICVSGSARIGLGGDSGIVLDIAKGDVCILPAGVGHRCVSAEDGFQVAGGYPPGQEGNIARPGDLDDDEAAAAIAALDLPRTDPITGGADGVPAIWAVAGG